VGRLNDLMVKSGGDNNAPAPVEQELGCYPVVEQVVVVGDGRPWLSAIICLAEGIEAQEPKQVIQTILKRYNQDKTPMMHIRKAIPMTEPCSIENGMLTPTHKIKRAQVIALHQAQIDKLYSTKSS